ncbi:MAG: hypothetical protein JWO82_3988 [Akkermansiaceae bacterium]|nr:hypothetical protein [Akkermansiaceae bacterium]
MRFLTLLLSLLPLSSFAQEAGHRTCRLLFLGERGNAPATLQLFDGKTSQLVDLPRMNLSKNYRLPPGAINVSLLTSPPAPDQPLPAGTPTVAVGEKTETFYLLLTPDATNKVIPLRMQLIDASSTGFKPGQMMWYNLTPLDVFGKLGTQQVNIKGRSKSITDAPAKGNEDYNVDLSFRMAGDPKTYPICETHWIHDPAARSVTFLFSEAGSKVPRVLSFRDNPEPPDKDKESKGQ